MSFLTATANKVLDKILRNTDFTPATTVYLALHTSDPGGTGANEVTGGSYARQAIAFDAAATKHTQNSAQIDFTGMPATTVSHISLWSLASGGTEWWEGALTASKTTAAGDTLRFPAGDVDVDLT